MHNHYPLWKYGLIALLVVFGLIYAAPNLYGDDLALQISRKNQERLPSSLRETVTGVLAAKQLPYLALSATAETLVVRFATSDQQLQAQDSIKPLLGSDYTVALNLAPRTPPWLKALGAQPMKLGLDLRGGVHFLLDVDSASLIKTREESDRRTIGQDLRSKEIRYTGIIALPDRSIEITFQNESDRTKAYSLLASRYPDYQFQQDLTTTKLTAKLSERVVQTLQDYAVEQAITVLRNRINELGVSEPIVQRQGRNQISVDLPGVQDTARAKEMVGKTATVRFQLVDTEHDLQAAILGNVPVGSRLYYDDEKRPVLLKNPIILRGDSISYATAALGEDGRPEVQIRLGGGGESRFHQVTGDNIGKPLAVVYVESIAEPKTIAGVTTTVRKQQESVISVANINSALGLNFRITGLNSERYAQNLALLLRSGALAAPIDFVQERTIGPSLGAANIDKGVLSVAIGFLLVFLFMLLYYRLFGLVANVALLLNIVFVVALLSIIGATLTLPGVAGIVLTVGMAVDANVLINERIREELRSGLSPLASIHAGYERAFATIVDSNVTTLIVAMVLFALGSGSVKGFAVTLTLGILTSMVTAIFFTRAIINVIYGRRVVRTLSIGSRLPQLKEQ